MRDGIVAASRFAEVDPYRAATHNKGIMNGVDAVVIATGNDWRGVEAGAHAFAARDGRYRPLATWRVEGGTADRPTADAHGLGTVGGTLRVHPGARLALRMLGVSSARSWRWSRPPLGFSAKTSPRSGPSPAKGIQRGHMALHRRAVGPK